MSNRLNYFWRLAMTSIAFTSFGLGSVLLTLLVFPAISLTPGDAARRRERTRWMIHKLFKLFVGFICAIGIMKLHVRNGEALRDARGVLVLANHPTLIDVVVLLSLMPHADCVVKGALWGNPILGGIVRAAGYISNNQSPEELVEACTEALRQDGTLIIFPEGTRSIPGKPLEFLRGASHIALGSGKQILPVVLSCDPPTLSKKNHWYDIPPRRFNFRLDVQSTLSVDDVVTPELPPSLAVRRLTEFLTDYFTQASTLHGQPTR